MGVPTFYTDLRGWPTSVARHAAGVVAGLFGWVAAAAEVVVVGQVGVAVLGGARVL